MLRQYLWRILNAVYLGATNAKHEVVNAMIQKLKSRACGFRNRARLKMPSYFTLGALPFARSHILTHKKVGLV